ncbi:MAG: methylated-DNA--[protein]-cysteine S-methyltransferase [Ilumatobacteraceae bacterium]|jgi:methylated-DNA-[protein]-cysteine S-methyltransferase
MTTITTTTVASRTIDSPVGPLTLGATPRGLRFVWWPEDSRPLPAVDDGASERDVEAASAHLDAAATQLREYFDGTRTTFDVALDPVGTEFQLAAWTALRTIDFASTVSYGEQARRMGDARKARAVGAANGRNPISIIVPCHRVVGADGSLTGFAGGLSTKAWLLDHERRVIAAA